MFCVWQFLQFSLFCSFSLLYPFMQLNRNIKQKSKYEYEAEKWRITRTVGYRKCKNLGLLQRIDSPLIYANCQQIFFGFFIKKILPPLLSLSDVFTATLRPLTATNFPWPPSFFYSHIWSKWPWPRPPGNPGPQPRRAPVNSALATWVSPVRGHILLPSQTKKVKSNVH